MSLSNGVNESALHAHRFLLRTGLSLVHAFAWVFIFEYFYLLSTSVARALESVVLLYAFAQFITIVTTPVSAAHLAKGTRRSLVVGALTAACAFVVLGASFSGFFNSPALWGLALFATLLGLYRALYFVPYKLVSAGPSTIAHAHTYFEVLLALMPLFAGLTLVGTQSAPARLLFGAGAIIVLASVIAYLIPDTRERFSWPYIYTFKQLFRKKNQELVLQSLLEGMQGAALFLIWPLAIFLIVEWSYVMLGVVFSVTLLAILLMRRFYLWFSHRISVHDSPIVHTVVAVSGWIARLAAGTPVGIIIADVYSYSTLPERGTRVDPTTFEHVSDRGAFLDEYTALKEIGLALGRIMLCVLVFFLAFAFVLPVVLAIALSIAAVASGISVLVARRGLAPAY
ncbi:hypothetical protein HYW60_00370 [Candidatus Kaiserbacteria bacterium]|nr:hypothetical protein [Candidatus Kaiserbacteria bacterium]